MAGLFLSLGEDLRRQRGRPFVSALDYRRSFISVKVKSGVGTVAAGRGR